jgi:hypothetical protein
MSPDELKRKRREMWADGHCCTGHWQGCVMCAERRAEIDAKYPPVTGIEVVRGREVEREATETAGDAGRQGAADQGGTEAPTLERPGDPE